MEAISEIFYYSTEKTPPEKKLANTSDVVFDQFWGDKPKSPMAKFECVILFAAHFPTMTVVFESVVEHLRSHADRVKTCISLDICGESHRKE